MLMSTLFENRYVLCGVINLLKNYEEILFRKCTKSLILKIYLNTLQINTYREFVQKIPLKPMCDWTHFYVMEVQDNSSWSFGSLKVNA